MPIEPTLSNCGTTHNLQGTGHNKVFSLRLKLHGTNVIAYIISAICIFFSLFHLYTAGFGSFTAMLQRSIHLTFSMVLAFLIYPTNSSRPKEHPQIVDVFLSFISMIAGLYVITNFEAITIRINELSFTIYDYIIGGIAILLVLETTRRTIGWALTSLAIIFLLYAYFGPYMPGLLNHRGYSIEKIISHVFLTTEGIFGTPLAVSATFVVIFIIFGAFLEKSGAGSFFINLATAITGRSPGGPAKAAVVSSGFMGMMSGSALANVATTGIFTIPLMKKTGYESYKAAAIEAVSSTGGMTMPPIMGAVAFIMAEYTGISYFDICVAAAIPAFLYYTAVYWNVHLEALKNKIKVSNDADLPSIKDTLKNGWHLIIPIIVLVVLLIHRYSPMKSAFYSVIILFASVVIRKWMTIKGKELILMSLSALISAGKSIISIAAACACAGIVIGVITLTGIGLKFSVIMIDVSHGIPFIMLFLMAIACLILGMGLPPSASYIITAALGAPALINIGYPLLGVNLFIFYYANLSNITPPIAMAAYAASGIADSSPMKTGFYACKIGIVAFLIPFMFVYWPSLLLIGLALDIIITFVTTLIGIIALTSGIQQYLLTKCNFINSTLLLIGGLLLMFNEKITDVVGLSILGIILILQHAKQKKVDTIKS